MHSQLDAALAQLSALVRRGRAIRDRLDRDPRGADAAAEGRIWQHDCAAVVSQLSGGSKAHWLSRAYSTALLVRSRDGAALTEADAAEIVTRVLDVLDRAASSLVQPEAAIAATDEPPALRRFDFVRDEALRPVLERAYVESALALEAGDYTRSLLTTCSVLEAIITDALSASAGADGEEMVRDVLEMSFTDRIAAAEARRLIGAGCARLPPIGRDYRVVSERDAIVTRRDAVVARQVLHVVLRDLDPGR
jgi:hypothetical protein